jgi:hypothetical protein
MHRKSWITACLLVLLFVACKEKKKQLLDIETVEVTDFIDFFNEVKLPFQLADTSLIPKSPDSLLIGNKVFAKFVPDTVIQRVFGKTAKPQLFSLGKTVIKDGETYLFLKAVQGTKRTGFILVFNDDKFVTAMPVVTMNGSPKANEHAVANMDSRYTITTLRQRTTDDGSMKYNKNVYVYNSEGVFTLILTESNDQNAVTVPVINPIDTLKKQFKLSGDYMQDKKNIVSIRDGRNNSTILFFIHFEKDGGSCKGELKGEAKVTGANSARFTDNNGTCAIDFVFSGNTVRMKELEGCGSYRDIKCFFEGSYTRKKKAVPPATRKKK